MARTSIALDTTTATRLRRLKVDLSERAGHVLDLREVVNKLLDHWDATHRPDGPEPPAPPARPATEWGSGLADLVSRTTGRRP